MTQSLSFQVDAAVKSASSVVSHKVATSLVSSRTVGGKINRLAGPKVSEL